MGITGIGNYYSMGALAYNTGSRMAQAGNTGTFDRMDGTGNVLAGDRTSSGAEGISAGRSAENNAPAGTADSSPAVILDITGMPLAQGSAPKDGIYGKPVSSEDTLNPEAHKKAGRKSSPEECQTCKERKYQDGSDENVSFKSAAHISPEAAGAAVRAHEGEHVSNAYKEAAEKGGEVVNASVTIHTAICPECGRTYVSGGTTNTTIRFSNEKENNPYEKAKKAQEAIKLRGKNIDYAA